MFFALDPVEVTIFGINVYAMRNIILMMDFVRHTHLKLSYGRHLERDICSARTIISCITASPRSTGTRISV